MKELNASITWKSAIIVPVTSEPCVCFMDNWTEEWEASTCSLSKDMETLVTMIH